MIEIKSKSASILLLYCTLLLPCSASCQKKDEQIQIPLASIEDAIQIRTAESRKIQFNVYLDKVSSAKVSIDYMLVNGTAIAVKDFEQTSGTLTIEPNQSKGIIEVDITGDKSNLRQNNLNFSVQLSNAKNCNLTRTIGVGTIITENGMYLPTKNSGYSTPTVYPGYTLTWSDEFIGSELNRTNWNTEIGNGNNGWGNNELQYYTGSFNNVFVSDGNLVIEARKELQSGFSYTSSRLTSQGKRSFKFGRVDIRAKLPVGKGIWPALWMLGNNITSIGWPACGETDIMELVGTYPSRITGTAHWASPQGSDVMKNSNYILTSKDFSSEFHVFSIIWKENEITWYVDDQLFLTVQANDVGVAVYPFNAEQFFILNVAVGGNWPGAPDGTTQFPQRMFVDYVRVFQK
ncbi:MAG: family 16 glycosylhydrolase [Cyclobacteriaceae bacterium]|nr:family 16 glycosylhydrolase [Cyclobacteriaceae bacterium]